MQHRPSDTQPATKQQPARYKPFGWIDGLTQFTMVVLVGFVVLTAAGIPGPANSTASHHPTQSATIRP